MRLARFAAASLFACSSAAPPPPSAPSERAPASDGPAAKACADALASGLRRVESVPMEQRVAPALLALGGCEPLGPLAAAARSASALARSERARSLCLAATPEPRCSIPGDAPASRLPPECCAAPLGLSGTAQRDLDAGTCLFTAAVRLNLASLGLSAGQAERLLSNLLLASALEGEAERRQRN